MEKWIICLFFIFTACAYKQGEAKKDKDFYNIDFKPLLKKKMVEELRLDQWGKTIRYIPLETTDSVHIESIKKIILEDGKLLAVHDSRLSLFNTEGRYLYDIGKNGEGETEYSRMFGLYLRNDTLFVVDGNYDFTRYGWDGTYRGKSYCPPIRHTLNFFLIPNTDIFLGHVDNYTGNKEVRFVFFRDTTAIKIIPNTERYEPASDGVIYSVPPEMKAFDGTITAFKELFNDTIYQVDKGLNLQPYAVVDLGKHKATKEAMFAHTVDQLMKKWDFFDGKIALDAIGEKDGVIYLAHHDLSDPYVYSYDKAEGQAHYQKVSYPENPYGFKKGSTFVPHFISTDGKYLIDFEITENGNNPVIVLVER